MLSPKNISDIRPQTKTIRTFLLPLRKTKLVLQLPHPSAKMDNTPQRPSPKLSPLQPSAVAVSRNTVILANETTKDYTLETKPDW